MRFKYEAPSLLRKAAISLKAPHRWLSGTRPWVFDNLSGVRFQLTQDEETVIRKLAAAMAKRPTGRDLDAVANMPADDAHAALVRLHGVGPWTADIYLLFCLGHADAWPAGDLALQEAARMAFGLKRRPHAKAMMSLAESWRPWRGVAAHLLWNYYRVAKGREGVLTRVKKARRPTAARTSSRKSNGARVGRA